MLLRGRRRSLRFFIVLSIGFILFPEVDIVLSSFFYDEGNAHWIPRSHLMHFARTYIPRIVIGSLFVIILLWVAGKVIHRRFLSITGRKVLYLLLSLAIGPGIIVESILKTFHGRARPRDIIEFGGNDIFTPIFVISDACQKNCSFVSGHAALMFWTTAFMFLVPASYKTTTFWMAVLFGALMGVSRMAEGAHFFSDIVFAGIIVVFTNVFIANYIIGSRKRL